jgi:gluconolactonase
MKRVLNVMVAVVAAVLAAEAAAQPLVDLLNKKRNVELVAKGGRFLEGPVFDREGNLWVVEVGGGYLSRVEGDKVVRVVQYAPDSAPQGAALHQDGRIFVTDRNLGVWSYDPKSRQTAQVVRYFHGQSFKGPNDLTFDSKGNLWFTDAWGTGVDNPTGALYMAEAAGGYKQIRKIIGNLAMPNGVQFNADESILYIAELRKNRNWRCQMDKEQGGIGTCAVFTNFMSGNGPDGLKLDEKGNVYQAHFLSGGVYVASPVNDVLEFIRVPSGRCTTNLAFRPGTKWLYITEACENAVWRVEVDNPGMTLWGLR